VVCTIFHITLASSHLRQLSARINLSSPIKKITQTRSIASNINLL
jgi:hypothetical protein